MIPTTQTQVSKKLFNEAQGPLVGGVDSPVRAFKSVGQTPIFMKESKGAYLYSEDNDVYIDYVLSFGPHLLGHNHPKINSAISKTLAKGISFGAPSKLETILANLIIDFFPTIEKLRFVNSGTEACMSAIRLARGYKNRDLIVKFNGCYHGHADSLLVSAGSGNLTFGVPDSAGVPKSFADKTIVLEYNDIKAVKHLFKEKGHEIAGIIVEPVCGNMGVVLPQANFLETLRSLCTEYESLLIFDEVMTGFRSSQGGAQALFNIEPDITCLGKVIGGGLPCGAYGGKSKFMNLISPEGPVYQAGTLSGNPLVMSAGIAALEELKIPSVYDHIDTVMHELIDGIADIFSQLKLPFQLRCCGSMFTLFFTSSSINNLADVKTCDTKLFSKFHKEMIDKGIYLAPSQFEANFISSAHTSSDIQITLDAIYDSLKAII